MSRPRGVELAAALCITLVATGCRGTSSHAARPTIADPTTTSSVPLTAAPTSSTTPPVTFLGHSGLTVTSPAEVGHPATFTGRGCGPGSVIDVGIDLDDPESETSTTVTPFADGTWRVTMPVRDATPLGAQTAQAVCKRATDASHWFFYTPVPVEVTTPRRIRLTPASGLRPGTALRVTPTIGCPTDPTVGSAVVEIANRDGSAPDVDFGRGASDATGIGPAGHWAARLTIPRTMDPGLYAIDAACIYFRATTAWYPAVPIAVLPSR